jgi:hypothetical protein
MKISQELPQFENKKALIITTGEQEAEFYLASNGEIEKIDSFRFEEPTYSDREGHFESRGGGNVYGSGSVYEPKKQRNRIEFRKRLENALDTIYKNYKIDSLYVFSPDYMKNYTREIINEVFHKRVDFLYEGHYHEVHPFELLKIINKQVKEKREKGMAANLSKQAIKILDKAKMAREKIKGKPKK